MLQVARLAPTLLGDSRDLVRDFYLKRLNPDGGFQDRAGDSDLYYTVFGLEGLAALEIDPPAAVPAFLDRFGDGGDLDFVHLTCLARAWATAQRSGPPPHIAAALRQRIERYRSADGGFSVAPDAEFGTPYGSFLALGAIEDLGRAPDNPDAMLSSVLALRAADGGYANHPGAAQGSTPATAAAVLVMRHLDREPETAARDWLLARSHADGGFFAAPAVPVPDLLSTATALHALVAMHADISRIKEPCLDFVDSLWTNEGGFCGSWVDQTLDCEYTYYGLLALGHLSL
jgi:geranylgeranyl transferase type-2 subunit beta